MGPAKDSAQLQLSPHSEQLLWEGVHLGVEVGASCVAWAGEVDRLSFQQRVEGVGTLAFLAADPREGAEGIFGCLDGGRGGVGEVIWGEGECPCHQSLDVGVGIGREGGAC